MKGSLKFEVRSSRIGVRSTKVFLLPALVLVFGCDRPLPSPGPVSLVSPADRAVLTQPAVAFSWEPFVESSLCQVQVARSSKFQEPAVDETTRAARLTADVRTDGRYYWRVRQQSDAGIWGAWSGVRQFELVRFRIVANAATQGYAQDIWVEGSRCYIADGQAGLAVFDVSSPEEPRLLGTVMDSLNEAWGVASRGRYAYVAYGYKELMVVDVANAESIRVTGELEYPQPGYGYDVAVRDSWVYIAADAQFIVVNAADARYPQLVFQHRYPRGCRGVALAGDYCYLALEQLGVAVWSVAAMPPVQVGSFDTPSNARGVAAAGDYLYVADGRNGIVVADVSRPGAIAPVARLALDGYANRISIADTLVYVGCSGDGLAVVNVRGPGEPFLVAQLATSYTRGAQESAGYIFACDRDSGLVVIKKGE